MDNLNKHQIILLTLLVSFITSIATGIVTVTLLDQAPPGVTQTINRVVEKTIEKVIPVDTGKVIREVTTVVVNEEERTLDAVEKNAKSIVRINATLGTGEEAQYFTSIGVIVDSAGFILTDPALVVTGAIYEGTLPDGKKYKLEKVKDSDALQIIKEKDSKETFVPVTLGNSDTLRLGQSVIALGGRERSTVGIGNVTELITKEQKKEKETDPTSLYLAGIETNVTLKEDLAGGPLLNLSGELVAIRVKGAEKSQYLPINLAKKGITSTP
ncbi:MAG: trypsin-like peptidase domain-containing protein [bacterium]|nr:trypsin-like peptidase domain-containing protein [bacterium]